MASKVASPEYKRNKLKTLIHYVAYRFINDPHKLDAVKLNKALWFSDVAAYIELGVPITGDRYIRKPMGPVSSSLRPVLEELENEDAVAVRRIGQHDEYLALTKPDVSVFTQDEIVLIEDAIDMVDKHTTKSISEKSHNIVWRLAEPDEEIPYHAIHAARLRRIESTDVEWAHKELAAISAA